MAENSKIEWTDHTFNPWIGCTKVSPGCLNCYAETLDTMRFSKTLGTGTKEAPVSHWGKGAPRHRTSESNWKQPLRWNRDAAAKGIAAACCHSEYRRPRVFCSSLADWLDDEVPIDWLADLLELIRTTPHLDWLLLTKRPENFKPRLQAVLDLIPRTGIDVETAFQRARVDLMLHGWKEACYVAPEVGVENYWIGTTVENQAMADLRIPELLKIPAAVRFLSCEPLLGPVVFQEDWLCHDPNCYHASIGWVICGGESGSHARPMHPDWARALRDQCAVAEVPFFFKQWGEHSPQYADAGCSVITRDGEWLKQSHTVLDRMDDDGAEIMYRAGKAKSGRLLDGVEHNGFPVTA